jgi:hypothetical protein
MNGNRFLERVSSILLHYTNGKGNMKNTEHIQESKRSLETM